MIRMKSTKLVLLTIAVCLAIAAGIIPVMAQGQTHPSDGAESVEVPPASGVAHGEDSAGSPSWSATGDDDAARDFASTETPDSARGEEDTEQPAAGAPAPAAETPETPGSEAPPAAQEQGDLQPTHDDTPEKPSESAVAPVARSRRQAEVMGALEALSKPEAATGRAKPTRAPVSTDSLTQKVVLWRSELRMTAALAARRLRELEEENRRLGKLGVRLPWGIRRGRVRPAQGREEREQLIAAQERFDALYDELTQAAQDVGAETDAYGQALERARALKLDRDLVSNLEAGLSQATRACEDFQAAAQMAVSNARLVSDIIPHLDAALQIAETQGRLRRSEVRITGQTPVKAVQDLRQLAQSLDTYLRTGVWPGTEAEPGDTMPSPWPVPELTALVLLGALLAVGLRRMHRRLVEDPGGRFEGLPEERRALTLWRYARGFEIVRAALIFALPALAVQSLPLSPAGSLALTGLVFAWCAYAAMRSVLRLLLAPGDDGFGLLQCDAATSRRTAIALNLIAVYSALLLPALYALSLYDYPQADVILALKLIYGAGTVIVLVWLLNSPHGPLALIGRGQAQGVRDLPPWAPGVNLTVSLAAVALLVMTAMGYANLSSYLARSLVLSGLLMAVAWPAHGRLNQELANRFPVATLGQSGILHRPWLQQAIWIAFMLISALLLARVWGIRRYHLDGLMVLVSQPLIDVKGAQISILAIIKALLVLVVAFWAAGYARRRVQESAALSQRWDHGTRHAVGSALYYCLLAGGIVLAILVAGMQLSILAAFAGMFGIAIGFGSQDIAKNTICGLIIMLDRSINAGDFVDVAGQSGTIVDITVRSTNIRTLDNRLVVIPNSVFYTQNVVVSSQRDRRVRLVVDVAVAPETDFDTVARVLRDAAIAQDGVLDRPTPEVLFSKLAANGLNLQLIAWTDQIDGLPTVQGRLMHGIWRALKEHEIALV